MASLKYDMDLVNRTGLTSVHGTDRIFFICCTNVKAVKYTLQFI